MGYYGNNQTDDCCKKDCKEKCDCCCVPGIKDQLVVGTTVVIFVDNSFLGLPIAGNVLAVDCDTVLLGAPGAFTDPIDLPIVDIETNGRFSLCDISAVLRG